MSEATWQVRTTRAETRIGPVTDSAASGGPNVEAATSNAARRKGDITTTQMLAASQPDHNVTMTDADEHERTQ